MSLGISSPMAGPGLGIWFGYSDARVVARSDACVRGDLRMIDQSASDAAAATTSFTGKDTDGWATIIQPAALALNVTQLAYAPFVLCLESIAIGFRGRVQTRGVFPAAKVAATVDVGDVLFAAAGADTLTDVVANRGKFLGITLSDGAGGTADVLFEGIEGLGNYSVA